MPAQDDNANTTDPVWQSLVQQWTNCVWQAHKATKQLHGPFDASADPHAWQRQYFEALGRHSDSYLRSPLFLRMMRAHLDALVRAPQAGRQSKGVGGRNGPSGVGAFDLSKRLDQIEETLLPRLENLERRLHHLGGEQVATTADGWDRFLREFRAADGAALGVTPQTVVYQVGLVKLVRYVREPPRYAEPVLICFALVNRPYVLDLQESRSVVRVLLERGFEVYLIDWGTPSEADRTLRLQDYVCRFMKNVADVVCRTSASPRLNLLGYCMGGTMSTMYAALNPQRVCNLVLMAAPIDFEGDESLLNLWARDFDVDQLIDAYGNCPGEFLRYCFQLMKPVQNFAEKFLRLAERLDDNAFLDNFFAMERWANDSIPVAGETFREFIKWLYQENRLVRDDMRLAGRAVKLAAITCPLLMLVAEQDHLVPPASTLAIRKHVRSQDTQSMSINTGHIGLAVSSKAHRKLWPQAANWLAEHSTVWH